MTKTDLARLFGAIAAIFTRFEPANQVTKAWLDPLTDITLDQAEKALDAYAKSGKDFPPTAYQILEFVPKTQRKKEYSKGSTDYLRSYVDYHYRKAMAMVVHPHEEGWSWRMKDLSSVKHLEQRMFLVGGVTRIVFMEAE